MAHAQEVSRRFGPERRLKRRRDFLRLQGRGSRRYGRRFIYYFRGSPTGGSRLGITVSRKVGGAVTRNRIKRWTREVFRHHPELFEHPVDLVMIAKRDIEDFSYIHIEEEFKHVVTHYFRNPQPASRRGPDRSPKRGSGHD